jgi:hypothetical protein
MSDATKKLMSSKRTGELNPLYGKSPFFFPFFLIIIKLLHISLYIIIKKRKKNKAGDDTKELMRQKALGRKFSFFFPFFLIIIKLLHISLYIIIKKRKKNKAGDQIINE